MKVNDISTGIVISHNDTMSFCEDMMKGLEYYNYRPLTEIVQGRNRHLHQVMHYRSHQADY